MEEAFVVVRVVSFIGFVYMSNKAFNRHNNGEEWQFHAWLSTLYLIGAMS